MLRPFPGQILPPKQKLFNDVLSSARKTVEDSFGRLYRKFRIYGTDIDASPNQADLYILATCALHNYIQIEDRSFFYYGSSNEIFIEENFVGPEWSNSIGDNTEARKCRNIVMEYLYSIRNN
jgi:hypothetical protein